MFKHCKRDSILVFLLIIQVGMLVIPFFYSLSKLEIVFLFVANVFLMGTNYQCIAHNFIHLPFFKNNTFNKVFSVLNSLGLGLPQSMYRVHHLNHHRHNNRPDVDESSTLRYGKNGREENIFKYSIMGIFRTDMGDLYRISSLNSNLIKVEIFILLAFYTCLAAADWKLFLFYLLPTWTGGQIFALWENYCEHHHANPYDRKRDSVSCYGTLYNLLWFNNGYHQEHHFSPMVHWTKIAEVQKELPEDRVIVKGCHLTNSF